MLNDKLSAREMVRRFVMSPNTVYKCGKEYRQKDGASKGQVK